MLELVRCSQNGRRPLFSIAADTKLMPLQRPDPPLRSPSAGALSGGMHPGREEDDVMLPGQTLGWRRHVTVHRYKKGVA